MPVRAPSCRAYRACAGAGRPPSLTDLFQGMGQVAELRRTPVVFVAVGLAIAAKDARRLDQPAPWGSRLVRTTQGKAWHRGSRNASEPSYIDASLIDFNVCREASWLVGWSGSTFARTLARYQMLDRQHSWYAACPFLERKGPPGALPPGLTLIQDNWHDHRACAGPKEEHVHRNRTPGSSERGRQKVRTKTHPTVGNTSSATSAEPEYSTYRGDGTGQ